MLVLFDVDGTLTETSAVEADVYSRVFRDVFGSPLPSTDWSTYEHATDQGVVQEAVDRAGLDARRIPDFTRRFVEELRITLSGRPALQVPGAARFLVHLTLGGHRVAFATGAWAESARAKLSSAEIDFGDRVLVGSDFHVARREILLEALRRAPPLARVVYVGDGPWDVKVARELTLPFLGVDRRGDGKLSGMGARDVIADFRDDVAALAALQRATVPSGSSWTGSRLT